ncbi:MAG: hypothetical protein B7Z37_28635 [Verrucomicrobia bacterium 12-59-8]|nr:MAG: hypothetical protein B7Z37_28635 [Verrucomicrobia bacterium 12-59-8]
MPATAENIAWAKSQCKHLAADPACGADVKYKIRYSRPASELQRAGLKKGAQLRTLRGCVSQLERLYYRHYGKESECLRQLQTMLEVSINEQYRQAKEKLQCKKHTEST